MTDKQRFFALAIKDRRRIAYLVGGICVVQIVQFLIAPSDRLLSRWGGIALNVLVAYWSIRPQRAPEFWFAWFPYLWFIPAIFESREVIRAVQLRAATPMVVMDVANLLLLVFLAVPLSRFYRLADPPSP
jgi:hypothetical protein